MPTVTIADFEDEHFRRLNRHAAKMERLYRKAVQDIITQAMSIVRIDPKKPFSFKDYPALNTKMENAMGIFAESQITLVKKGMREEWLFSAKKNDLLVDRVIKGTGLTKEKASQLYNRNLEALALFQDRKTAGLNLSDRVWKYTNQFKGEIEMALDIGLSDGRSAQQLSRDVRQYLQQPDKLFRRVRDKRGILQLSKNAKNYHPGAGVYRSSYKNAMRMTRTEINMAYRASDHERYQQLPFIVGFEVVLSNTHPAPDICDDLKGKYPKDFKFVGWHPQCKCHTLSILATDNEVDKMTDAILNDEPIPEGSVNQVGQVPAGFTNWIKDNEKRMEGWKSKPYFMTDNLGFLKTEVKSN